MKPFSQWKKEEVEAEFQLKRTRHSSVLEEWLNNQQEVSEDEATRLAALSQKLLNYVYDWNEEELKVYFIAFLLDFVDFYQEAYRPFLERELAVEYEAGKKLSGLIDFVVASGTQSPKEPFFFLHEYKKEINAINDPLGQILAEMVAAQMLNSQPHPIYGAYIIGRHWYFVVLDGKVYEESLAYDATKEDINAIVRILREAKDIIDRLLRCQ